MIIFSHQGKFVLFKMRACKSKFKFLLFKSLSKYLVMLLKELGVWNFFETRAVQIRVVQELTL